MTEDQDGPIRRDRREAAPDGGWDDDRDMRELFRRSAPTAPGVDVEALFSAAEARRSSHRRLVLPRWIGGPREAPRGTAGPRIPPDVPFWKRGLAMFVRIAAAAAAVAATAALLLPRESAAEFTFAEVQAKVEGTRTIVCRMATETVPASKAGTESSRLLIRDDVVRLERPDGGYTITDYRRHKFIIVEPAKKWARVMEGANLPVLSFYEMFRSIAANPIKELPPREIGGVKAVGFIVRPMVVEGRPRPEGPEPEITVWVDPGTKLPLRVETVVPKDERGVSATQIVSDIVFDGPLDPSLFDLTPPEGYQVESNGVADLRPDTSVKDATGLILTPGTGIGPVRFGMSSADVARLLGPPDKTLKPADGVEVMEYYSRGFSLTVRGARGVLMVHCYTGKHFAIKVRDFAGKTDKGVRMGADRAAIEKAYGPPSSVREYRMKDALGDRASDPEKKTGQVSLRYAALGVEFSLHDDALDSIIMRGPRPESAKAGAEPGSR